MGTKPEREPMTPVDSTWLGMDRPTNPMVINGVMLFDQPVDFDQLKRVLDERLAGKFTRFRQRVVEDPAGSGKMFWETDPNYDIRAHVYHIALPAPGDTATLQQLVGALISEPLDHGRPLWRFFLIDNYGGGCAVFTRLHHSISDGVSLTRVLLSLTDSAPGVETELRQSEPRAVKPQGSGLLALPAKVTGDALALAANATGSVVKSGQAVIAQPERAVSTLRDAWLLAATSGVILAKLLVMAKDRSSAYQGDLSLIKRVAWTAPLPLEEVKAIGKALGATINDVLVAVVAGALRRYLLARGDDVSRGNIRAMVPVNLRAADAELVLGNQFSLVYLGLPVSVEDPQARLAAVKRQMDILKHSPEPVLVYEILNVLGMVPGDLAHWATDWFATKASMVLTNVPGPREPQYFAGQRLRQMIFWVPQSGGIGMGISIFSYAAEVVLALLVDNNLVSDPEAITAGFEREFAELREVARAAAQTQDPAAESGEPTAMAAPDG